MTPEEALLVADAAHDTNTVDAVALTTLATEVRRQGNLPCFWFAGYLTDHPTNLEFPQLCDSLRAE